jgi:hypothetical protein
MAKVKSSKDRVTRKISTRKMSRSKTPKRKTSGGETSTTIRAGSPTLTQSDGAAEDRFVSSSLTLHELFQQQTRQMLDRSDLEEEQKQTILVAMNCPCCGAGAMSFTAKLRF